jgi:predicted phage replisome organizer
MSNKKRYYWLKLKEDFFDEDAMSWLEEQPNGKEYCLFYLKLCLKSLKGNGTLIYNIEKLSEITKTNKDTVIIALQLLKRIGFVSEQDNGAIYTLDIRTKLMNELNIG